jgi:signal transduction histidine kinase
MAGLAEQAKRERAAEAERARQEVREERVRIARELHDVVAHTLAVITVQAGVGRRLMAKRPEEAGTALESIEMIGRTAQDELRVVLGLLRDEDAGARRARPGAGARRPQGARRHRAGLGDARRAANIGHRPPALPGA